MHRWVFLLLFLCACNRELVELRQDREPEYLGRFSGVYEGLDTGQGNQGRTLVVQFRDKVLLSPIDQTASGFELSKFATVIPLDDAGDDTLEFSQDTELIVSFEQMIGPTASCDDDVVLDDINDFFDAYLSCFAGSCTMPCVLPVTSSMEGALHGTCLEGKYCRFAPMHLGGRLGRDGLQLYFGQESLAPASLDTVACPEGWARCVHLGKLCDFDSQVAGVYGLALEYDQASSTAAVPEAAAEPPTDFAFATAHHLPIAVVYTGREVLFGSFDPFTLDVNLDAGDGPGDPAWRMHPPELTATMSGQLVEDEDQGLERLIGEFTVGSPQGTAVFNALGERQAGAEPGVACSPVDRCTSQPPHCPMGTTTPPGHELLLDSAFDSLGCVVTTCTRRFAGAKLCAAPPACGGPTVPVGEARRFEVYDWQIRCTSGTATCSPAATCVEATCGTTGSSLLGGSMIDVDCGQGSAQVDMLFGGFGAMRFLDVSCQ